MPAPAPPLPPAGTLRVQAGPFDPAAELAAFGAAAAGAGAIVTFTGIVRDLPLTGRHRGGLQRMEIEHYPGMTERAIAAMMADARARWALRALLVIHRHGALAAGEPIMMVATAADHRAEAFAAADFLMDYLKSRAPFWKKEHGQTGADWVAATEEDENALDRWD